MGYSLEPRKRKYVEGYGFFSFAKIFASDSVQKLIDTATKNRNRYSRNCF